MCTHDGGVGSDDSWCPRQSVVGSKCTCTRSEIIVTIMDLVEEKLYHIFVGVYSAFFVVVVFLQLSVIHK